MADTVVQEIKDSGGEAVADYGNVSVPEDARNMVKAGVDNFGKLDILIAMPGFSVTRASKTWMTYVGHRRQRSPQRNVPND
ncbi:MAG: hypothetical protein CM1200mP9_08120 [Gammaproteobacteria bacterium]|nr:MAG: hypothetical protein CM1200mP9_08120 [Gammaproteobacteria bacterium]